MAILEVNNLKKVYTTRLGGNQVEGRGIKESFFFCGRRRICSNHGRIRFRKDYAFKHFGSTG